MVPFRGITAFEKLYSQRTSLVRTFSDLKDNYNLDNIRVAKMARVKVFMDLSCIALLTSKLLKFVILIKIFLLYNEFSVKNLFYWR